MLHELRHALGTVAAVEDEDLEGGSVLLDLVSPLHNGNSRRDDQVRLSRLCQQQRDHLDRLAHSHLVLFATGKHTYV